MLRRNKFGRFLKRGQKRRHRAKRRTAHRRRPHHVRRRRRRGNPHMLLANPSGQRSFDFFPKVELDKLRSYPMKTSTGRRRKGRKRKGAKRARSFAHVVRHRRRRGRKYYRIYRGRGRSPKYRIFRRSNPFGAWMMLARLGIAGGLGIVAARISARLYTDHASKIVLGAAGGADPKSFRAILNEGLRIVAMGALPILAEKHVLRRLPMVTRSDGMAFQLGALAEAGRQGIGVVIKKATKLDAAKWGLDGALPYVQYHSDGNMIYGLHPSGQWYAIGRANGMSGLMPNGYMGGLQRGGYMGGLELASDYDDQGD